MVERKRITACGFTLIELLIVVALVAIILALAAPSFTSTLSRHRVEGVASEFVTDLQYARSEAVAKNLEVRLATGAGGTCYTLFVWRGAGVCTCTPAVACTTGALATDPTELKTVSLAGTQVAVTPSISFPFDPVRGMLDADRAVTFSSSAGPWQLTTAVSLVGRASTCSPSGSLMGYPSC